MGVLTDFFVASPAELNASFSSWLEVADEPNTREVMNLFTKQKQVVPYWPPKKAPTGKVSEQMRLANYQHLPHAEFKGIDTVMLAMLHHLISGIAYESSAEQFDRPALIDPLESDETGLFQLSPDFVSSLATLSDSQLNTISQKWSTTEEMELSNATAIDCEFILQELIQLAKNASDTRRDMYYWWSL